MEYLFNREDVDTSLKKVYVTPDIVDFVRAHQCGRYSFTQEAQMCFGQDRMRDDVTIGVRQACLRESDCVTYLMYLGEREMLAHPDKYPLVANTSGKYDASCTVSFFANSKNIKKFKADKSRNIQDYYLNALLIGLSLDLDASLYSCPPLKSNLHNRKFDQRLDMYELFVSEMLFSLGGNYQWVGGAQLLIISSDYPTCIPRGLSVDFLSSRRNNRRRHALEEGTNNSLSRRANQQHHDEHSQMSGNKTADRQRVDDEDFVK